VATDVVVLFPGGYAPRTNGATPTVLESTGSLANAPQVDRLALEFPITTDKHWLFEFKNPSNYSGNPVLRGTIFSPSASPGVAVMKGGMGEGVGSISDDVFLAANNNSGTLTMPATANQLLEFTIPMTSTSIGANDSLVVFVGRDADSGSNTCTSSVYLVDCNYEYTTT